MIGILLELIVVLTIVGIPVMLFPILKKQNEALALGFLGFRFVEAISAIVVSISQPIITSDIRSGICKSGGSGCFLLSNLRQIVTSST